MLRASHGFLMMNASILQGTRFRVGACEFRLTASSSHVCICLEVTPGLGASSLEIDCRFRVEGLRFRCGEAGIGI